MKKRNLGLFCFALGCLLFGAMVDAYSNLSDVRVGNFPWCLKVRVIRLWVVKSNLISGQENSIELVLLDEKVKYFI